MRDMMQFVPDVLPEITLMAGAVVALIFALFAPRRLQSWAALLALVTLVLAALSIAPLLANAERMTLMDTYAVDRVGLFGALVVLGVATITIALSIEWFRTDPRHGEYYVLLLLSTLGTVLLARAADLMELALGVLLVSSTAYVLVAWHRTSRRAAEAAMKYYLLGALTNGAMVYGIVLLFGLASSTTFGALHAALGHADPLPLVVAVALVIVGLAFELAAVPAHAWLPDVADGAPTPVAAFVSSAPKIGALIALARLMAVIPEDGVGWRPLVAVLAALTMTLGNVAALWQDDVRRLLGWSAVSQTGYALMAVVALGRSPLALPSLLYFLVAYVLGNLAAFGVVVELRGQASRARYAGLGTAHPLLAFVLVVAFLSFIGIPPLAGFAGKMALFGATIDAGYAWLAALAAANTVVSVAYYVRVLAPAYFEHADAPLPLLGEWAFVGTATSAVALVALGIAAEPLFDAFARARLLP